MLDWIEMFCINHFVARGVFADQQQGHEFLRGSGGLIKKIKYMAWPT